MTICSPFQAELPEYKLFVREQNEKKFSKAMKRRKRPKFAVGDKVRIAKSKTRFSRSYLPTFQSELFEIVKVKRLLPKVLYDIKSISTSEKISGSFYESELTKVTNDLYVIEKVLRKTKNRAFVKWKNYDSSHNSWVNLKDVQNISN